MLHMKINLGLFVLNAVISLILAIVSGKGGWWHSFLGWSCATIIQAGAIWS